MVNSADIKVKGNLHHGFVVYCKQHVDAISYRVEP